MGINAITAGIWAAGCSSGWSNVSLLLHCDTLVDSSSNALTLTNVGVTVDTTTYKYGQGSLYFNGSSYINITDNSKVELDTQLFTIECWVRSKMTTDIVLFSKWEPLTGYLFVLNSKVAALYIGNSIQVTIAHTGFPSNEWFHLAISRDSTGYLRIFINGVLQGSDIYYNVSSGNTKPLTLGCNNDGYGTKMTGYIDDFRFTKGVCIYTSNFTPPTQAFQIAN